MTYEFAESYKNIAMVRATQNRIEEALEMSDKSVQLIEGYTGLKLLDLLLPLQPRMYSI